MTRMVINERTLSPTFIDDPLGPQDLHHEECPPGPHLPNNGDLASCPSGECQDYTYDGPPRPISVVIHTRDAFEECQHLEDLMRTYDGWRGDH